MLKYSVILDATKHIHHQAYEDTLKEKLSSIIRNYDDAHLSNIVCAITNYQQNIFDQLDTDIQLRITKYLSLLPNKDFYLITGILNHPRLATHINGRIKQLTYEEIIKIFMFSTPESHFYNRIIELYSESSSYDSANSVGQIIRRIVWDLSQTQIEDLRDAADKNSQISDSTQWEKYIKTIVDQRINSFQHPPLS